MGYNAMAHPAGNHVAFETHARRGWEVRLREVVNKNMQRRGYTIRGNCHVQEAQWGTSEKRKIMESNLLEGLWLSHSRSSNEMLICTMEGVVKAWTVRMKPAEERWSEELIMGMKGRRPDQTQQQNGSKSQQE